MIVDLESGAGLPEFDAEVCIVGAGAAGIVLAAELVRQGRRVLLLESGGTAVEPAAQELTTCVHTGQPHRSAHIGRVRALGGTTTAWGGQVLEFTEEDFDARAWVPGSGWPFGKDEIRPYYERALVAEGLASAVRSDEDVWRRMKMGAPPLGSEMETYFTRWCPEPNFARLYAELLQSAQLLVVLHATGTGMALSEDRTRVVGLRCKAGDGREHTFAASHYALCLGTIETVRFLLQPVPGATVNTWDRGGLLGRHFQSHIDYNAARIPARSALRLRGWFANAYLERKKYHPKFRLAFAEQQRRKVLNIAGSITCIHRAEPELRRVKRLVHERMVGRTSDMGWADLPRLLRRFPALLGLGYGYRVQRRAWWSQDSTFWLRVHCEQEPLSQGCITLTDVRDGSGLLRANVEWRVSKQEWRTVQEFTAQAAKSLAALGATEVLTQPEVQREDGFRDVVFDDSHHPMGGTRMAVTPMEGVVDAELKLHGVENAYVCSASVFPTGGFSNPTHTLIALAIRLADRLISQLNEDASA
jgi:choline dehydrogenase-like flavoprotein